MSVLSAQNKKGIMTAVIILNWNGADYTIACLDSLSVANGSFFIVIADNGSRDDSLDRLKKYATSSHLDIRILELGSNHGFAGGNNLAIQYASRSNPDNYLLLNNDTEVMPDLIERICAFQSENERFRIIIPRINYWSQRNVVWNCGGHMFFGFRKYRYANCNENRAVRKDYFRVSFVTGCALFFMPDVLNPDGTLFTDRFFFGEEDFDLSWRMNALGIQMASVTNAVVYHKVSSSESQMNRSGKVYLHLLNRYIDMKIKMKGWQFFLWRCISFPATCRALGRSRGAMESVYSGYRRLMADVWAKDSVTEDDFKRLVMSDKNKDHV